ncbi:MAG TPA: helix-turn-helix domain-containing GNAT family N-acetyltransferase [Acetobacteraceae bacterium]|jgi:DNA-binding MarR family transcriptional regulator/ribosomal protein S18 acetylase RimI-like enzyme|nr:helix-turn-helix domain-containing GNAT family N-acetyltransferase [Acetobacteraceae bacterium]
MVEVLPSPGLEHRVTAIRRFNRFYTGAIGALHEGLLQSRFSLTEARVLYELAQRADVTATELGRELDLDSGYLSRILQRFEREGLIVRALSEVDRRQSLLSLTAAGREAFAPLDARSREEVGARLAALSEPAQASLVGAMQQIEALLGARGAAPWLLRQHRPGDIGWVVARHGALYAEEYGLDARFEALVAQVAGAFLAHHDPARERCWIAERDGVNVGSVFLVQKSDEVAKLRLLIVEPTARGSGIGRRLVTECIGFARSAGYRRITLWTNDVLLAARTIYQQTGFRLVASAPHQDFGPPMIGEDWERALH